MRKVEMLDTVETPRIIFIGGSNVAFGLDSKRIIDSVGYHVINFGLHAGIGIRYPMEDYLQYIKKGDVVMLQFEYTNFYGGEDGTSGCFSNLMVSTAWRNLSNLTLNQKLNLSGLVAVSLGRVISLLKYPFTNSFDTPSTNHIFEYTLSGFNEYGDETSHFNYPDVKPTVCQFNHSKRIKKDFVEWLSSMICSYESRGARVYLLPPVCIKSYFDVAYNNKIEKSLMAIGRPYVVEPSYMTLNDNCMFDAVYHINKNGVCQNTNKIIRILSPICGLDYIK